MPHAMIKAWIVLAILATAGSAQAASTYSTLPNAAQPLGTVPDYVPMDQGSGCQYGVFPCQTVQSPSLRMGQPLQTNCSTIIGPFLYQQCWNTTVTPALLEVFNGTTFTPLADMAGSIAGPTTTVVNDCAVWANTTGSALTDAPCPNIINIGSSTMGTAAFTNAGHFTTATSADNGTAPYSQLINGTYTNDAILISGQATSYDFHTSDTHSIAGFYNSGTNTQAGFLDSSNAPFGIYISGTHATAAINVKVGTSPISYSSNGFQVDTAGIITATGFISSPGGTGVTCAGAPTSSFASANGLVTHC